MKSDLGRAPTRCPRIVSLKKARTVGSTYAIPGTRLGVLRGMHQDGSLIVRFRAGGLQEMAFHAFTWNGHLEVLEPPELREMLCGMAERAIGAQREGAASTI